MTAEIVVVNFYTLRDPDGFDRALRALVPRVRLQGHVGLRSYRFFGSGPKERRLVAIYQGPAAWVGHHDLIMGWPEMAAFRAVADLDEVLPFGPVTAAMQGWLDRMALGDRVRVDARGAGFAVSAEGQALTPGLEGQIARVRTDNGRVLTGRPVADRQLEVKL